jgi:3-oxoacyl-[acyl-carrier-protein] synthase III
MRIRSVSARFPERRVSNAEIVEQLALQSCKSHRGPLDPTLDLASRLLKFSGIEQRRWLSAGEPFFPLVREAVAEALGRAGLDLQDIDLLIHAGVDRKVLEPGLSFMIAKALGMKTAQCFDILEACNSWVRAMDLAKAYLLGGNYRRIMIVTSEFTVHEGEWGQKSFELTSARDLEWSFASLTLGEGATATILDAVDEGDWQVDLRSLPEYADLCLCPLPYQNEESYLMEGIDFRAKGGGVFVSYASRLQEIGIPVMAEMFAAHREALQRAKIIFPHAHSKKCWIEVAKRAGFDVPYYFIYPEYGNLISSSIPAAMALAEAEGKLRKGDPFGVAVAAAGMTFGIGHANF